MSRIVLGIAGRASRSHGGSRLGPGNVGHVGRLGQGIGHLVRRERPRQMVREEPVVFLVARHVARRQAIGLGIAIVRIRSRRSNLLATKCFARASSSSGWTGGLARLMSSGGSTSPLPKSCAQTQLAVARAKYGLSGRGHPVGQRLCAGLPCRRPSPTLPSSRLGSTGFLVRRWITLTLGIDRHRRLAPSSCPPAPPALDLGEKGGKAVVGVLGPDVERMIVALGAPEPEPQEPLGGQLGLNIRRRANRARS